MVKFIHFSDAHIGVTTHGKYSTKLGYNDRISDFLHALDSIVDAAIQYNVNFVIFAGDLFHHNTPSPAIISEVSIRLKILANHCPIIMVPGNHDQAANRVSTLNYLEVLDVLNIYTSDDPTYYIVGDDVFIGCVPYPQYSTYNIAGKTEDSKLMLMGEVADTITQLQNLGKKHKYSVLVFHGTVSGAQWGFYTNSALGSESSILLESLYGWDYVALGHIHLFQDLGLQAGIPIVYAGSIERVDFGERVEDKGYVLVEITQDQCVYEFHALTTRQMIQLEIDLTSISPDKCNISIASQIKRHKIPDNSLVRVIIHSDDYNVDYSSIYPLLQHTTITNIVIDVPHTTTVRFTDNVEELEPIELLEEYFIVQNMSDDELDALLDLFEEVMDGC